MREENKMTSNKDKAFHMTILGKTGTGKTWYLLDLLEREYKGYFNYIYLICPTIDCNRTWKEWKYFKIQTLSLYLVTLETWRKKLKRCWRRARKEEVSTMETEAYSF